ncbi:NAD(P)/FAD-dependent oxidoreductase [Mycobacterium sp. 852002-51057_SCH5723018]|uniref:phytoene desaturase family protein n=1 Tax=Mycobacterium sp. 852002-51057_SCH5723018 TaxID=1834094 RepID=UPI0007FC402B|nr:NAD(P)/FAD-dependent oxidoreductase [Mycobacterium sp. 852002-51057_SCH5723018]OBG25147.1 FAD-dependent oxidoreductase [Mycobacterium sp. 852002-51057_SCH5723018]
MSNAVVVGAGPNGLAAAIHLARHGIDVQVLEARDTPGGGARSGELTVPGVIHDHCSAAHPMGVGSPFWQEIDLQSYGLAWKWPEIDCAHPLDDGTAGVLYHSIEETAAGMGPDATRWRRAFGDLTAGFDQLAQDFFRPVIHVPRHPVHLAAFGPRALLPATVLARWFRTEQARAVFGGASAHMFTRLDRPLTAAMGLMFLAGGQRYGWPVAEGGSGSIIAALVAALEAHGGTVTTGVSVAGRKDVPDADIVMLDLSPAGALRIYGDDMPARIRRSYRRYRQGSSAFKVDFAVEGDIPWTNPDCRRAGTVHLGGTFAETADTERQRAQGIMARRPFVLVGQQYLADPSRSAGDVHPIWAYAHVPFGYTGDATAAVVGQIERFAPGFRDRVIATVSTGTAELEAYNPNYIGGDIIGGANDGLQVILRPRVAVNPYATGVPGVYLCSQSTPPGAGIHGLCGYHAAESALGWLRKRGSARVKPV